MEKGKENSSKLLPHYSGRLSHKFWNRVNSVKGKKGDMVYSLGCILQNLESKVVSFLQEVSDGK